MVQAPFDWPSDGDHLRSEAGGPWLFRGICWGLYIVELCGDYFINHGIRIHGLRGTCTHLFVLYELHRCNFHQDLAMDWYSYLYWLCFTISCVTLVFTLSYLYLISSFHDYCLIYNVWFCMCLPDLSWSYMIWSYFILSNHHHHHHHHHDSNSNI